MLGLLKLCYTCLGTNNKELMDISKMDFDNITFLYKLRVCVSNELEENSSKQICTSCIKQLRVSFRFREMVLLSQKTLDKHRNEIISGTYVVESKLSQFRMDSQLFEPECVVVKQELANAESPINISRSRYLRAAKPALAEEVEDQCYPEIPTVSGNDSDSSDYFLADLKTIVKNQSSTEVPINSGNNNINEYLVEDTRPEENLANQYQCAKCNVVLEDLDIEQHSCNTYDSCDNNDTKEETKQNSKDDVTLKGRRGRPKKKMKNPKPEVEYECYHCSMIFNKRWKLQKHITRVHSDNKKYVCTYCNKGFKQSYHLREHLTSHTGERNYTCSFCDKSFQRISSMRRHIRSHEAAPGQKTKRTPFLCTVCGKSFPFSNGVQRHMRIHLGIKNHECSICQRRFTQSTHLHVHMRTHTGEKPYVCDTCGEAFSLNASLQKHMTVHQNISRTNLLVCKKINLESLI